MVPWEPEDIVTVGVPEPAEQGFDLMQYRGSLVLAEMLAVGATTTTDLGSFADDS